MRGHNPDLRFTSTVRRWVGELFAVFSELVSFLLRPNLTRLEQSKAPLRETVQLFAVLCAVTMGVASLLLPIAIGFEVEPSNQMGRALSAPALEMILVIVILGPLIEELAFRSWLSGQRRYLAAGVMFVVIYFGGQVLTSAFGLGEVQGVGAALLGIAIVTFVAIANLRKGEERLTVFERFFPAIFWFTNITFGVLHLTNYDGTTNPVLLIFTLPQVIAGLVFSYARIRIGLWSAIGLHSAYNAIPVAIAIVLATVV